jgi:hypothetical protein
VLDTVTGNSGTATVTRTIANTTAYLQYRINITLNNGDGSYTGIRELQMYEANDYATSAVAGGGFICGSTCTITLTRANSLVGNTVLRWTGGAGITTNINVVSVQEYNYTMLVEGTGTLNMTGNLSQVGTNSVEAVINVTGNCIFNFVGTLKLHSFEYFIVVYEKYNSKFHHEIVSEIAQINGLTIGGYCESLKCFYFQVDPLVFKTKNEVFQVLELKTKKFSPVFKEGTTSSVVISNCQRN